MNEDGLMRGGIEFEEDGVWAERDLRTDCLGCWTKLLKGGKERPRREMRSEPMMRQRPIDSYG